MMMTRRQWGRLWLTAVAAASILLGACGKQETSVAAQQTTAPAAQTAKNYITVGVDAISEPLAFFDVQNKTVVGYEIDLAKEVFKRAGIEYQVKTIDWAHKDEELLKNKTIDIILGGLTITNERKGMYAISDPYMQNKMAILVRADSPIQNRSGLKGKTVAVQAGSVGEEEVKAIKGENAPAKVTSHAENSLQFAAVLAGQADAAVLDSVIMEYYVANSPGKFRILSDYLQEEEFGFAARPDDTDLIEQINKALAAMKADGTELAIRQKWFGGSK